MAIDVNGIKEEDIRIAKWMLKTGKTKKAICEYLKIAYNTTKLDKLIKDFDEKVTKDQELKLLNKNREFSEEEKRLIANDYSAGMAPSKLSDNWHISVYRIKKILVEMQIPIRGRSRKDTKVDHIKIDPNIIYNIGDRVLIVSEGRKGKISKIYGMRESDAIEDGELRLVPDGGTDYDKKLQRYVKCVGYNYFVRWPSTEEYVDCGDISMIQDKLYRIYQQYASHAEEGYVINVEEYEEGVLAWSYVTYATRSNLIRL